MRSLLLQTLLHSDYRTTDRRHGRRRRARRARSRERGDAPAREVLVRGGRGRRRGEWCGLCGIVVNLAFVGGAGRPWVIGNE